jgi:wyosine [tRNA(Phe)-imidazoG37] synthetase (radical SAM superfamily)
MLIKDLNDSVETLTEIASHLREIQPDEVHILLPTRPPVEPWVKPADQEGIQRARDIFGSIARVVNTTDGVFELAENENLVDAVVDIITRHPMQETEIIQALKKHPQVDVKKALNFLEISGKAQIVNRFGVKYWSSSSGYYPELTGENMITNE